MIEPSAGDVVGIYSPSASGRGRGEGQIGAGRILAGPMLLYANVKTALGHCPLLGRLPPYDEPAAASVRLKGDNTPISAPNGRNSLMRRVCGFGGKMLSTNGELEIANNTLKIP
jgi:hypothetical protein